MFDTNFVRKDHGFTNCGYQSVDQFKQRLQLEFDNLLANVIEANDVNSLSHFINVKVNIILQGCEILNEKARQEKERKKLYKRGE